LRLLSWASDFSQAILPISGAAVESGWAFSQTKLFKAVFNSFHIGAKKGSNK